MYTEIKNPQWANAEHTMINCEVNFNHLLQDFVPFSAVASGDYDHSHQIFAECVGGKYGVIAEYVAPPVPEYVAPPEPTKAELLAQLQALTAKIEALV